MSFAPAKLIPNRSIRIKRGRGLQRRALLNSYTLCSEP